MLQDLEGVWSTGSKTKEVEEEGAAEEGPLLSKPERQKDVKGGSPALVPSQAQGGGLQTKILELWVLPRMRRKLVSQENTNLYIIFSILYIYNI